jgi:hypothetical protein
MSDKWFPQINYPYASKLQAAVNKLHDYDLEPLKGQEVKLWELFLAKLEKGTSISNADRMIGLLNVDKIPFNLKPKFLSAFKSGLLQNVFDKFSKRYCIGLIPYEVIDVLLSVDDDYHQNPSVFPLVLKEFKEISQNFTPENICMFILSRQDPIKSLQNLALDRENPIFTSGQNLILEKIVSSGSIKNLFTKSIHVLPDVVLSSDQNINVSASKLNILLQKYMDEVVGWQTEVLSKSKPIGVFLSWYRNISAEKKEHLAKYSSVQTILSQYALLAEVLNELAEVEQDRADYWRAKLEYCSFVLTKKFKKGGAKVGVAFGVGEYVIVEMAPKGNAAYLYLASDFENKIRGQESWKVSELGQDYPGLTDTHIKGSIRHSNNWQSKIDRLLNAIRR